MSWRFIYFDRSFHEPEIYSALSKLFDVDVTKIKIVSGEPDLTLVPSDILLICGIHELLGDFPLSLEITPLKPELIPTNEYQTVAKLCEYLSCSAVITNGGGNPYKWILVNNNSFQYVMLDSELLDKEDDFQIKIHKYLEQIDIKQNYREKSDFEYIWIFMGKGSWTPTAVFTTFDTADKWIRENHLEGYLSQYPMNISVYDWAIALGLHKPKLPNQKKADHIQKFGSAFLEHHHYEND